MFPIPTTTLAFSGPIEELGREMLAERLDAEPLEQGMAGRVAVVPQDHAEAARVAQAQRDAAENEIHMIVLAGERSRVDHTQAPRHAQVHDERAGVALEQQILSTPHQTFHPLTDQDAGEFARYALTQIGIAHSDARNRLAEHERLDAAAGDLDFGQLWHSGAQCPCRPFEIYLN